MKVVRKERLTAKDGTKNLPHLPLFLSLNSDVDTTSQCRDSLTLRLCELEQNEPSECNPSA